MNRQRGRPPKEAPIEIGGEDFQEEVIATEEEFSPREDLAATVLNEDPGLGVRTLLKPPERPEAWWDQFLQEHGERLRAAMGDAVETLTNLRVDPIKLDNTAFSPVFRMGWDFVEHFLAGKTLDAVLPPREKNLHRDEMNARLPEFLETALQDWLRDWEVSGRGTGRF